MIINYLVLLGGGILAGIYGGSVGGAGLVGFPLLILSGLPTNMAIGTLRLSAVMLEASSTARFYKEGKIKLKEGLFYGLFAASGAIVGSQFIIYIDKVLLDLMTGIIFFLASIFVLSKNRFQFIKKEKNTPNIPLLCFFIFLSGIYGGFLGVGYGTLIILLFVLFNFELLGASAKGRFVGFIMSLTATIVFSSGGFIDYASGLALGAGYGIGGWLGVGLALKQGERYVRPILLIVILFTIFKLVGGYFGIKFF